VFLLLSGCGLVVAAIVLLGADAARAAFALAGLAVQIAGLVLLFRAHRIPHGDAS